MKSWLNGSLMDSDVVRIAPNDRGFLLSDGLFETFRIADREALHFDWHMQRLRHGLSVLKLPFSFADGDLLSAMADLIAANDLNEASLRLTVTRGTGPRGLLPPEDPELTVLMTCAPLPPAMADLPAARLVISSFRRNEGSPLSRLKVINYLDNILALQKARADGYDDAILLNNAGFVTCASAANIFLMIEGRWVTPPVSDGVLPGITRRAVMDFAREKGFGIGEESIPESALADVQAAFLTNSLINIRPIASINGRSLAQADEEFLPEGRIF